ncbi:DUF6011 domain-containing protein [Nocardia araoensis]|uniref:DUF6011 domain-containing protein n=1 Tax=Nocardia araoensis TaxID=228600 RepID=UPI000584EB56|nr:hypothetical protein [Nocardia araoensis]
MTENNYETQGVAELVTPSGVPVTELYEDKLDAAVLAAARERGFRLAVRCNRCGQWVVAAKSVALHLGPTCRRKIAIEKGDAA